jgi:hypothetical protein
MLFQAVMKFLSRLVEFKILVNWGMVHYDVRKYYACILEYMLIKSASLQKRAARVILDVDTRERSAKLFKGLNWLPLHDEIKI